MTEQQIRNSVKYYQERRDEIYIDVLEIWQICRIFAFSSSATLFYSFHISSSKSMDLFMSTEVLLLQLIILVIGDILLFQPIILNVPQERERVLVPERGRERERDRVREEDRERETQSERRREGERERERERDENDDISYYRSSTHTARHLHSF